MRDIVAKTGRKGNENGIKLFTFKQLRLLPEEAIAG
jgi:hypothetical protein